MTREQQAPVGLLRLWTARVTVALLVMGTSLAVVSVLRGRLGPEQARWMVTAFVGAFFLGASQASGAAWDQRRLLVGRFGQVASLLGFAVFLWGMWLGGYRHVWFWKSELSLLFLSLAAAHTSLLALARVPPPLLWLRALSVFCGWFVAGSLTLMVLVEWVHLEWLRWLGISLLLLVSSSFVLAVVHRLDDPEARE